ncbi:6868_t:CDS:2 [Entrophospora sp. SA101]|nr:730_t:CDS:2 [Entrophospora sp. SA101]CAJ0634985.1 6868_t:CDS:2 [Entrophospora sp. SA101]CAJ0828380.1 4478_t:CDS:2 [Entrophospora sp. SA101]CAJ0895998.1 13759_t:CDS:2 [Entrophospora sp. SA101]CAJ0922621.1 20387_t:CDS:2 [Entrophospora sp. SA101]
MNDLQIGTSRTSNGIIGLPSSTGMEVAPEEPLRAIVINRPTAQMIETYRLPKPKDQMSEQEINNLIMSPVPQGQKVLCKITRKRDKFGKFYPLYELFIEERDNNGEQIRTFLMSARKKKKSKSSHYIITTEKLTSSSTPKTIVGRVRSNFLGTAFVIYSHGKNPFKHEPDSTDLPLREELGSDPNILGFKGPRKMTILLIGMMISGERPEFRPKEESETLIGKFRNGDKRDILVLHNKSPQWNEDTRSYVLNFSGRVTLASVKNFQIVHDNDLDYIIMQFGRVSEDSFTMDFMYPMCPIQAFAIALTSFDAKLACE